MNPSRFEEVSRSGMSDEDILDELETSDTVTCDLCDRSASTLVRMRCCPQSATLCSLHGARLVQRIALTLLVSRVPACVSCGRVFRQYTPLSEVARVVTPL